jgi:hypothetical protein
VHLGEFGVQIHHFRRGLADDEAHDVSLLGSFVGKEVFFA